MDYHIKQQDGKYDLYKQLMESYGEKYPCSLFNHEGKE